MIVESLFLIHNHKKEGGRVLPVPFLILKYERKSGLVFGFYFHRDFLTFDRLPEYEDLD